MSNYNSYGIHISKPQPVIKKGDTVKYKTNYRDAVTGKLVYFFIYGKWDGEKATFNDKDQHIVRTTWWLEKVKLKERLRLLINKLKYNESLPYIPRV